MAQAGTYKSAIDDYLAICWRHHAKGKMSSSLVGKQIAGEDLVQLANDACLTIDVLLPKPLSVGISEDKSTKARLVSVRERRKRQELWTGRKELVLRLDTAIAALIREDNKEEWYYFWGLHHILELLPQTLEER